jgi:allene oxide cyclase
MKRLLLLFATLVAAGTVVAVSSAAPGKPRSHHHGGKGTIRVVEHADTDATTDTGAPGDSAGDILTFANPVFDKANAKQVGTDQGYCIRVVAGASYECTWTTFLDGGQIVVQGPFFDTKDSTLAITGGTGRYAKSRGTMELKARPGGTSFDFVFHLR